jgi:ribosomal protein S21
MWKRGLSVYRGCLGRLFQNQQEQVIDPQGIRCIASMGQKSYINRYKDGFIGVPACVQQQQQRGIVSVDVHGNKVDRALRMLRRKLIDEGIRETWMKQRVYVKPCQERKKMREDADKRIRTRGFKEKMRWILKRKARGY